MPCRWPCGGGTRTAPRPGRDWCTTPIAGSQYTSFVFTAHLIEAGIGGSIGTVGDALDNALKGVQDRLVQTEPIKPGGPWPSLADVELATAGYVHWFNTRRLHTAIGNIPPAEYEAAYCAQTPGLPT